MFNLTTILLFQNLRVISSIGGRLMREMVAISRSLELYFIILTCSFYFAKINTVKVLFDDGRSSETISANNDKNRFNLWV